MTDTAPDGEDAEWSLARREFLADERDRVADARDAIADRRDADADVRELEADLRDSDAIAGRPPVDESSPEERAAADRARSAAREARQLAAEDRDDARERRAEQRMLRSTDTPTILARLFSDIAHQLFQPGSLETVLVRVATVATDLVPGCDYASVTVISSEGPVTPVATDPIATAADQRQYEAGEGPCLDATLEPVLYTPDLHADPRWPRVDARDLEVRSLASFGLYEAWRGAGDPEAQRAALNLYGARVNAMSESGRELGMLLASYGSVALSVALERDRAQERDADLHAALLSRDVISQAKGILMEREKVTADEAFDILRRTSQALNRKLRDIAQHLAFTGELPPASGSEPDR